MNQTLPWHDPIVTEIHATRERLAEQYHNDLVAYSQAAETHCGALGFRIMESLVGCAPRTFHGALMCHGVNLYGSHTRCIWMPERDGAFAPYALT